MDEKYFEEKIGIKEEKKEPPKKTIMQDGIAKGIVQAAEMQLWIDKHKPTIKLIMMLVAGLLIGTFIGYFICNGYAQNVIAQKEAIIENCMLWN